MRSATPVQCQACYLLLRSNDDLRLHPCKGKQHHCPECGHQSTDLDKFKQHILSHSQIENAQNETTQKEKTHKETTQSEKMQKETTKNEKIQKETTQKEKMPKEKMQKEAKTVKKHLTNFPENADQSFQCVACGGVFMEGRDLMVHEGECTWKRAKGEGEYMCPDCGQGFGEQWYLKLHIRRHYIDRPFLCPYCPLDFDTRKNITGHIRLCHLENLITPQNGGLSICVTRLREDSQPVLETQSQSSDTLDVPTTPPESPSKCPKVVYGKGLEVIEWTLAFGETCLPFPTHLYLPNPSAPPSSHICPQCNRSISSSKRLSSHLATCQGVSSIRIFPCPDCEQSFDSADQLKSHRRAHASTAMCGFCHQRFSDSSSVRRHIKRKHIKELNK